MLWGAHDASSHDANMLLYYFSLWQNRDSPSGLAVESPCTLPVRSTVALCKDTTRNGPGAPTRNAKGVVGRTEEEKEDRKMKINKPGGLMEVNMSKRNWRSEKKEEQSWKFEEREDIWREI